MASTEELEAQILAEMESNPEAYAAEESNVLVIDNDLRTISIPEGIKSLGVESDDDVHRLFFQMPKVYGEFDLSTFDIRINYKNGNIGDVYAVEDKNADGDVITFSWLVGRNAVRTKGATQFIVCLKKSDSSGVVQQEFNTTVASLNVLEGLETTEQVVQENTDIIEQILKKIDGLTSISPEDIATAVEEYLAENPPSGMTDAEREQLQKNTEDISSLSKEIANKTGTGLSTEAIDKLEEVGNYLVYTTANGGSKWTELIAILRNGSSGGGSSETVPATGITLDKTTLSFTDSTSQTLTATVEPSNSTDSVTWETSDAGVATVSSCVVSPVSNGSCTITAKAGSYSASCEVTVSVETEIVTYTITNKLTNVSTDNPVTTVTKNSPYEANLTPDTDYEFNSVTVTMGGVDITSSAYANGVVTISSVTGNVVITAIANEIQDTGEVTYLRNISFDGTSYLDTEFIPTDINHRYVIGAQAPNKDTMVSKYIMGVHMQDNTNPIVSNYLPLAWTMTVTDNNYNADRPSSRMAMVAFTTVTDAPCMGQDSAGASNNQFYDQPLYCSFTDGEQSVWLDEELTQVPTGGSFKQLTGTTQFSTNANYNVDKFPILPIWLGRVNTSSKGTSYQSYDNNVYVGVKFYCFKVYDSSDNLIVNMRPARQGTTIGMYDEVREKFYPVNKNGGTVSYEEVEA